MRALNLLLLAIAVQGALIALSLAVLLLLRLRLTKRARAVVAGQAALAPVLHAWLLGEGAPDAVVAVLRAMPSHAALRAGTRLATTVVSAERHHALSVALQDERWVRATVARATSPFWWRRFDAARLLCIAARPDDASRLRHLLADRSPAVRLVAFDAAVRLGDRDLIAHGLARLTRHEDSVQAYHASALALQPQLTADALTARLTPDADPDALVAWIDVAGVLAAAEPLRRVRALAAHPVPDVRVHVARALRRLAEPDTVSVLVRLLADTDWRVRAQAARALGALRVRDAVDPLAAAVRDRAWWVRYRAALALAQVGDRGRTVLRAIADGEDALARDMARLVAHLSPAAVIEMSEV